MTKEQIAIIAAKIVNKETIPDNNLIAFEKGFIRGAEWLLDNLWVSVEDELPPFEEDVIVHYDNGRSMYGEIFKHGEMFSHRTEDTYAVKDKYNFCIYCDEKITHWMPIPKLNKK